MYAFGSNVILMISSRSPRSHSQALSIWTPVYKYQMYMLYKYVIVQCTWSHGQYNCLKSMLSKFCREQGSITVLSSTSCHKSHVSLSSVWLCLNSLPLADMQIRCHELGVLSFTVSSDFSCSLVLQLCSLYPSLSFWVFLLHMEVRWTEWRSKVSFLH